MKKEIWILIIMAVVIVVLAGFAIFIPARPSKKSYSDSGIQVISPKANEEISSPLIIKGITNSNGWSGFEGQVGTVKLVDYKGNILGQTHLDAITDWTKPPVAFQVELNFTANNPGPVNLVFHNENPSGDPAKDKTFSLPLKTK